MIRALELTSDAGPREPPRRIQIRAPRAAALQLGAPVFPIDSRLARDQFFFIGAVSGGVHPSRHLSGSTRPLRSSELTDGLV